MMLLFAVKVADDSVAHVGELESITSSSEPSTKAANVPLDEPVTEKLTAVSGRQSKFTNRLTPMLDRVTLIGFGMACVPNKFPNSLLNQQLDYGLKREQNPAENQAERRFPYD